MEQGPERYVAKAALALLLVGGRLLAKRHERVYMRLDWMSHPARRRLAGRFVTYAIRGRRHTNVVEHEPLSVYRAPVLVQHAAERIALSFSAVLPSFSRGFVHISSS